MFTNEASMVTMIEVNKTNYSDHNIVELSTNYTTTGNDKNTEMESTEDNILKSLNFRAKSANWKKNNRNN